MRSALLILALCLSWARATNWPPAKTFARPAGPFVVPPSDLPPAPYAEWAHYHWVWFPSALSNQSSMTGLVADYLSYNISVGAVDLDSLWSTGVNNFIFDPIKYPNASQFVSNMHDQNIRVILWVTDLVDTDSSNFQEGLQNGYYLEDGRTVKWWHGDGAFIDYTNPAALQWWHSQMDQVLSIGVDGWKTDGTDPYLYYFGGIAKCHTGFITERENADMYYGDFFNYTRQVRGPEGLIMSRPVDDDWSFSPRYVVFSGWVGDDDPTFEGMVSALDSMMRSAFRKYVNFGSDIGGYRYGGPPPLGRSVPVFTRWFQLGAFCPLMENGGEGEHRPWYFGNDTLATYKVFVDIHYELVPYLLSTGTAAYYDGESAMHPMAIDLGIFKLDTYDYRLGYDIFVAPMWDNSSLTSRNIKFPDNSSWIDWWDGTVYKPSAYVKNYQVPMNQFPVFHRGGSMLPLRVRDATCGHGDEDSRDALTILLHRPSFNVHERTHVSSSEGQGGHAREFSYYVDDAGVMKFVGTAHQEPVIVLIRDVVAPTAVVLNDLVVRQSALHADNEATWRWSAEPRADLRIFVPAHIASTGFFLHVEGIAHVA